MVGLCHAFSSTGSCNDDNCRFHHDIRTCETCGVFCPSGNIYRIHLDGKRHRKALERVARPQVPDINTKICELCQASIPNNDWERHQNTKRHLNKQRFFAFKSLLEEAEKDKHGISVSSSEGVDFGIIELEEAQAGRDIPLVITTSVPLSSVRLVDVKFTSTSSRGRTSP